MKLPTSNKTSSFGRKHYVKKGYYPVRLLDIKPYANKEGDLVPGKFGNQLIFEFAIYNKDEKDIATVPMRFEEEGKDTVDVMIPKFVYHQYKDKKNAGEFVTAITPNSKITALLQALGWTFSENDVELNDLIGNWGEANVIDYQTKDSDGKEYLASTIGDITPYRGDSPKDNGATEVPEAPKTTNPEQDGIAEDKATLEGQLESLENLHKDGNLSDEGYKTSTEQIKAKLAAL